MNRAELKEKLKDLPNAAELIEYIMTENGKDVKNEATKYADDVSEAAKYRKGGEKYIDDETFKAFKAFKAEDAKELGDLRKYKAEKEVSELRGKKETAAIALLKENKASEKAVKLLLNGLNLDKAELGEDGKIKDGAKLIEPLKKDYADYFGVETQGGAKAGNPQKTDPAPKAETFASVVAEKMAGNNTNVN